MSVGRYSDLRLRKKPEQKVIKNVGSNMFRSSVTEKTWAESDRTPQGFFKFPGVKKYDFIRLCLLKMKIYDFYRFEDKHNASKNTYQKYK